MSASLSSAAAPQKRESTRTPGSSSSWQARNSFATRFMPSRSGVTRHTSAGLEPGGGAALAIAWGSKRPGTEALGLAADGVDADARLALAEPQVRTVEHRLQLEHRRLAEIVGVALGVEAEQIVVEHAF